MNKHLFSLTLLVFAAVNISYSQCETWVAKPTQTDAENAHSIYRQALKAKDYPRLLMVKEIITIQTVWSYTKIF